MGWRVFKKCTPKMVLTRMATPKAAEMPIAKVVAPDDEGSEGDGGEGSGGDGGGGEGSGGDGGGGEGSGGDGGGEGG